MVSGCPEREFDLVPAPHTSRSKIPFSFNFPIHDEAEVLVARRQGNNQEIAREKKQDTHQPQVITQELAAELVNLRVSNIYDLSSVCSIP